jgi:hypothetical protein
MFFCFSFLLALIFGLMPKCQEDLDKLRQLAKSFDVNVPFYVESFYRYQVNNNISITPSFIWLVSPNQDSSNGSDVIGVIRTTFVF